MNGTPKAERPGSPREAPPDAVTRWLLGGDASVRYLAHRDLLRSDAETLRALQLRMDAEGHAARLLACRNADGHWGRHYYQPKWTSTHYTLLELKTLGVSPEAPACRDMAKRTLEDCMLENSGMNLSKYEHPSNMGVNGMVLSYTAYFAPEDPHITRLLDYVLANQKADGGFHWNERETAGEPHTTICVLEGLCEYRASGLRHRRAETERATAAGAEYLLRNRLLMDSGDPRFLKLSWPYRYRYDVLRALECFAQHGLPHDGRITPALRWLQKKRSADGRWTLENVHKGRAHAEWEKRGEPSRMITLIARTVLVRLGLGAEKGAGHGVRG